MTRPVALCAALVIVFFLSACRDNASLEPAAGTVLVDIHGDGFAPETVYVALGRAVRWTNRSAQPHSISSPDFTSGSLFQDWWFEATFDAAGALDYFCPLHTDEAGEPVKIGTVIVE